MNAFLESRAVVDVRQEFLQDAGMAHWCFSVRWRDGSLALGSDKRAKAMVDYKEVLSPEDFVIFARLRETRKELAKSEQVPAYAIFTNEQLAEMARIRPVSKNGLVKIAGIGESRIQKYGTQFLKILKEEASTETVESKG